MAKRRADNSLLHDAPSKRCYLQLGRSTAATVYGVDPPSLLDLLGSRSRKRPHYPQHVQKNEAEAALFNCDTRNHAANVVTVGTSGSVQDRRSSSSSKKRPREDSRAPETVSYEDKNKADEDTNTEDCTYNSFQYWRTPLPELDLSLLEDNSSPKGDKSKVSKDSSSSSDAMES